LLGHSPITQTVDTYSYLLDALGVDAVDGLDEAFGDTKITGVVSK
jgi:hypothetical protein